jgi:uncharacterized protein YbbC (DUF1343 family)
MRAAVFISVSLLLCTIAGSQPLPPSHAGATHSIAPAPAAVHPGSASFTTIHTGADQMDLYLPLLQGQSVAVFANPTSVVGTSHTGIPVVSLYGRVRFYTYISSLQKYLEAAVENDRPLIILDRPDPNGFYVDGPVLDPKFKSFVGMQPVPVVYGMTIGEYARMLLGEQWLDPSVSTALNEIHAINQSAARIDSLIGILDKQAGNIHHSPVNIHLNDFRLVVIPCRNYTHKSRYALPVKPSPNLPDMQSGYLYPSLCLFEGTPISIGRGTSKPFQQFGHPSFPAGDYGFTPESMPGARNPPQLGQECNGYDLSGVNIAKETGNRWSLKWLLKAYALFPDKEHFFTGTGSTFDRLAGTAILAQQIREGLTDAEIRKSWEPALEHFKTIRKKYLLYAD